MFNHVTVLLNEAVEGLNVKPDGIYVDCTLGGAGHSSLILKQLTTGHLYCFDQDIHAIEAARERLEKIGNQFTIIQSNFKNLKSELHLRGVEHVDGILFDLGVSSPQFDDGARGFSYNYDARLDMRMNQEDELSAFEVVNNYPEEKLFRIFKDYGEEKFSSSIAKKIVEKRKEKEIETTFELVDIIKSAMPKRALNEKQHPAKRVFQAIRIEVNSELTLLKKAVVDSIMSLNKNGRLLIITFHSLEDKIVKHTYEEMEGRCTCPKDFPVCVCGFKSYGKIITKKSIVSGEEEVLENPRARSAKLRIFERN